MAHAGLDEEGQHQLRAGMAQLDEAILEAIAAARGAARLRFTTWLDTALAGGMGKAHRHVRGIPPWPPPLAHDAPGRSVTRPADVVSALAAERERV